MAAQVSWIDDDELEIGDDGDTWHVLLPSGELKPLSLEQLDDLYRLDIIDESAKIWQPGTRTWTTLAAVAGIEPEAPRPRRAASVPHLVVVPTPAEQHYAPAARPAPRQHQHQAWPPAAQQVPYLRAVPAPTYQVPVETMRPFSSDAFVPPQRASSSFGAWLMLLAAAAGVAVTLYRNGMLHDAAHAVVGGEALYAELEVKLGGPAFGTPRSLDGVQAAAIVTNTVVASPRTEPALSTRVAGPAPEPPKSAATALGLEQLPANGAEAAKAKPAEPAARAASKAEEAPAAAARPESPKAVPAAAPRAEVVAPRSPRPAHRVEAQKAEPTEKRSKTASALPKPVAPASAAKSSKDSYKQYDPLNPEL